jgi:uncharacterized membrane protein
MQLSPEERKRIYEEEKQRIDSEERMRKEASTTSLSPDVAALLCYVGGWVSGIIFLIIEQKSRFVRFHAAQSIIVFGAISIIHSLFNQIPLAGRFFSVVIGIFTFVLWIILMVKAYHGEIFKVPLAGELAERLLGLPPGESWEEKTGPSATIVPVSSTEQTRKKSNQWEKGRPGRIVGSAMAIAWSLAILIFLNFFNQYIAFYTNDLNIWTREPILTGAFSSWLPLVTVSLVLTMLGHALLIAFDKYALREATHIILDIFSIIVITSLLSIFPFDFTVIREPAIATGIELGIRITLGIVAFGIGIGVIVRLIKLTANLIKGTNG